MKNVNNTNPVVQALKFRRPFNVFHTHVIDRAIMDAAVANGRSLEVDISITPEGTIYVGHPLSYYKAANLPPPSNLPLEMITKEAKAAGLFLILDLKDVKTIPTAREVISEYGVENCLVHAYCKELSFRPWPPKVQAIKEPNWEGEELPLEELLDLREATGVPLALSCHGITQERLYGEGEDILEQIVAIAEQGVFSISFSMPPDEDAPLVFANKLIEHDIVPMIRVDDTTPQNKPDFFLGFTDYLEQATDPKSLTAS
jgi:hypothetical protein